jgi:pyruvate dehydrogenase E2 component (dihydrolipoamide acetyltransferase)
VTDTQEPLPWRVRRPRAANGFVSPAVRVLANERGVDPGTVSGSGAGGRVTRGDIARAVPDTAASTVQPSDEGLRGDEHRDDEVVPFNNVRKRAAGLLVASKRTSPHALCAVVADYSAVESVRAAQRAAWREQEGFSLTYLPFIARAVVDALREFPMVNATVADEALVVHRRVHLGIAVDLDFQGLVVPVVRDADGLRMRALARAIHDLARRARAKRLGPDDLAGGTFTVTNPGASGTWLSFPIINQPQVGIVSTDGVSKQVLADADGRLRVAPAGHLCLTFDHRAIDGAYAGSFLRRVREHVETRDWSTEL